MRDAEAEEEYKEEISTLRKNIEHLRAELRKERLEISNWEKKHATEEEKHKITREELNKEKEVARALKVKLTMSEARRDLNEVIIEEDQEKIMALEEKFKNAKEKIEKQEISTARKEEMFKKAKELLNKEIQIVKEKKQEEESRGDSRKEMDNWFEKLDYVAEAEERFTGKKQNEAMKETERTFEAITNSLEALHLKMKEKKTLRLELVQENVLSEWKIVRNPETIMEKSFNSLDDIINM